jgi:hypothetical protein
VARALAVELASTEVDVGGAVAVNPGLGDKASGASIAGVEGNRLENGEHFAVLAMRRWTRFIKADAGNIKNPFLNSGPTPTRTSGPVMVISNIKTSCCLLGRESKDDDHEKSISRILNLSLVTWTVGTPSCLEETPHDLRQ